MKKLALHWKIIIGMVLGIVWALISASFGLSDISKNWIAPFGTIFLNALKLVAIPLVFFSVISGIISIGNPKDLGSLGAKTLGLYLFTTVTAISIGLVLVNLLSPGKVIHAESAKENRIRYEIWAQSNSIEIKDKQCISCLEANKDLRSKIAEQLQTEALNENVKEKIEQAALQTNQSPLQAIVDLVPTNIFSALTNNSMLQIIIFAIFFGMASLYIPIEHKETVVKFINAFNEVFLKMIDIIMSAAPFFVFALMGGTLAALAGNDLQSLLGMFKSLGFYALVVIVGLFTMIFMVYPALIFLFTRKFNYKDFFQKIAPAQMLAFSTSSSAATLPVTLEVVEENLKVSPKTASFVLPIGATVNMDGTSLYQAVAVIFLAQLHLIDLTLAQQVTIVFTATLASIGSAAVPGAGLVMLILVLNSVGLNPAWISIILPVDRILDMFRTTVNVTSDITVASIIDKYQKE